MSWNGWKLKLYAPTQLMLLRSFYMIIFSLGLAIHLLLWQIKVPISLTMLFVISLIILAWNILVLLSNIHKGMDKLSFTNKVFGTLLTKLVNETRMTRMSTYPRFYSLIKLLLRLELVTFQFNLFTDYTYYFLHSTYYHQS